jgi:hypothetical protein
MFTPWNESGAAEHLPFRSFAIRLALNLYHRGDVIPLGRTPWNQVCAVRFPTWGNFSSVSGKGVVQGYQAIPPGPAPWNPNRPATRMAIGISAGRSGETLFHKGEPIPLGIYIFSKPPPTRKGGGAFLPLASGSGTLSYVWC